MKLYTFERSGDEVVGAARADGTLVDLATSYRKLTGDEAPELASMAALIDAGAVGLEKARFALENAPEASGVPIDSVRLLPPLPRPRKIRGFSVFERHLQQARASTASMTDRKTHNLESLTGAGWRETPAYYYSDSATVTGHDETVVWPHYSNWIDYELELVAVIGKPGKDIRAEDAMSHIFGYTIMNDLSARDAQFQAMATGLGFAKGKDFDGSNPLGPCIVTADEIPDPYALLLRTRLNGNELSCVSSSEAYWRFPECIAYASQAQTIHAGEMFSTGCAPDCCSLELKLDVKRGDTIELEVEGIGVLRTHIA